MKSTPKKLAAAAAALLLMCGANRARSEWQIASLMQSSGQRDHGPTLPYDKATDARRRRFEALYQARNQRNVTAQIVPFLNDPFPPLRRRAARILGRLENPEAQPALQSLLNRMKTEDDGYKTGGISRVTLQLALGRINARSFKGQTKVATMVKQVGLSWGDLVRLSRKVNASSALEKQKTSGNEVIGEVVELLYAMGKRGEDVSSLAASLSLSPAQKVMIQGASLPINQEVNLILDSFSRFKVFLDSQSLVSHLLDNKPISSDLIVKRLKNVRANPNGYRKVSVESFGLLFCTAAQMDDPRVLPLLKSFEANPKPWPDLRREAQIAEEVVKGRSNFSPATPSITIGE